MDNKRTNRPLLVRGLKTMGGTVLLLFLGPFLLHAGLSNPEKPLYIPLVIAGIARRSFVFNRTKSFEQEHTKRITRETPPNNKWGSIKFRNRVRSASK